MITATLCHGDEHHRRAAQRLGPLCKTATHQRGRIDAMGVPKLRIESPSLSVEATDTPAYEVKFLLGEDTAREVERRLRPQLSLDSYADPALGGAYRITSVYFDTPRFDVYHRGDGFRSRKYRVHRYASEPTVYLERKTKRGQQVWKRRTPVPLPDLALLGGAAPPEWSGVWFARRVALRALRPVCRVTYERVAYVGSGSAGPMRLTFDRSAHGLPAAGPQAEPFAGGTRLLNGEVIVEFKFLGAMPSLYKEVIEALRLTPRPGSKYRRCVNALGLVEGRIVPDA